MGLSVSILFFWLIDNISKIFIHEYMKTIGLFFKNKKVQTVIAVALFLAIWQIVAYEYNSILFPGPIVALKSFWSIITLKSSWPHIWASTYRVVIGLVIGAGIGTVSAIVTRYFSFLDTFVRNVLYPVFQSIPNVCWALLFVLWFGLSDTTPILIVTTTTAPHFMINIWEGLKELDTSIIEMVSLYSKNRFKILTKIILPMLYSYIFASLRSSVMLGWKIIALGEVHGAVSGIGYMIHIANENYRIERMFGWTLIIAFILLFLDKVVFTYIDKKYFLKWKMIQ